MTVLKNVWLATVEKPNEARRHRGFWDQERAKRWAKRERGPGEGTWSVQLILVE